MSLPKISVVVPVRNGVATIERAILSVIEQAYPHTELIILDGGSTDGTLEIIERYNCVISYWHSQNDRSSGYAINLGIEKASGELIAQLMADDWFEPGTFHAIAAAYLQNPQVEMISCGGRIVCHDPRSRTYRNTTVYNTAPQLAMTVRNMCFGIPAMSSRFISKVLYQRIGTLVPFGEDGRHLYSADREMLLRAAVLGCNNIYIEHLGHTYLAHPQSATFGNNRANQIKIYQEHLAVIRRYKAIYPLTKAQLRVLNAWYAHQSVRLMVSKLCGGNFPAALATAKDGLKQAGIYWPTYLFCSPPRVLLKKAITYLNLKRSKTDACEWL